MPAHISCHALLVVALPALLTACNPTPELRTEAAYGASLFQQSCADCHGANAMGTPGLAPDLTTLSKRNGGSFPRDRILAQIDGLGRHGDPDAVMPEFGAGDLGPAVVVEEEEGIGTPIPSDLIALAAYLISIQQ